MEFDPVFLSRLQFAFVISFHIIFPAFTIGLAAWLATLEGVRLWTGNGTCLSSLATLANGSEANSIGPVCNASTIGGPSCPMTRKYRRSEASPVRGTTFMPGP